MNAPKALLPVCETKKKKVSHSALTADYQDRRETTRTYLQQGMSSHDGQKAFQTLSPGLDDFIGEPVRENLSWQWRNVDPGRLSFEDIPKGFEIGITPANDGVAQLESGDVGLAHNFVISVHLPTEPYRTRTKVLTT